MLAPLKLQHHSVQCKKGNTIYSTSLRLGRQYWRIEALQKNNLGADGPSVSRVCLGTMLFGEGTSEAAACGLLSQAAEAGVNFFDTAEMYPVPQRSETQGLSEAILSRWMRSKRREQVIIATKVTGPSGQMIWIRNGPASLDAASITAAIDGSLLRLNTDYIDLYQLHWPDRCVPMFGETQYRPENAYSAVPLEEQMEALAAAQRAGKIRCVGLSNETPWGLMKFSNLAKMRTDLPRIASLQNAYSLLCQTFDGALAECCHMEQVPLLAYSPLAMGLLTGKYIRGAPKEARLNKYKGRYAEAESRYGTKPNTMAAVEAYAALAASAALSPAELAIRFVLSNTLVASVIVGATMSQQLEEILVAAEKGPLPSELIAAIGEIHQRYPNPNP